MLIIYLNLIIEVRCVVDEVSFAVFEVHFSVFEIIFRISRSLSGVIN